MSESKKEKICGEYRCLMTRDEAEIIQYLGPKPQAVQPIDAGRLVVVPETLDGLPVKQIGNDAFRATGVAEVSLPEGLERIGKSAFAFCKRLRKIRLPKSLWLIGTDAFRNCEQLEEVEVPEQVKLIDDRTFMGCSGLVTARLPKGLEIIGSEAFRDCVRMEHIIPEMLPRLIIIGEGAFRGCAEMKGIFLTESVETIEPRAFRGCRNLLVTAVEGTAGAACCKENGLPRWGTLRGKRST